MKKLLIFFVLLSFIFISSCKNQEIDKKIDGETCISNGGRILNTLTGEQCMPNETDIGSIPGMQCPCVCCIPKNLQ